MERKVSNDGKESFQRWKVIFPLLESKLAITHRSIRLYPAE
ncbi:hypothetical protein [Porphyromonas levii]|nr:hypothetical protein [Porphyromonas levii]